MLKYKKISLFLVIFILLLTGCRKKTDKSNKGGIFYKNKDFHFEISLPNSFKYYQTQRVKTDKFVDIDFFVPTSDTLYGKEVSGYAKPFVIRIFNKDILYNSIYKKIGERGDKIYTIKFWIKIPEDWSDSWNNNVENDIINSFNIY